MNDEFRQGNFFSGNQRRSGFGKRVFQTILLALLFGLVAGFMIRTVGFQGISKRESGDSEESAVKVLRDTDADDDADAAADTDADGGMISRQAGGMTLTAANTVEAASTKESLTGKGPVADVAAECMPTVVAITSVSIQEIPMFFGYGSQKYKSESSGSGIIMGENEDELLIATNNHVVSGASTLSVLFIGESGTRGTGTESTMSDIAGDLNYDGAVTASVKGTDADNDLAVIAVRKSDIPEETMRSIKIAVIGDSDDLVVGEQVVAIGNALGYGQSVTSGWISALNRSLSGSRTAQSGLIQTDAAINPGNSGGALLNMNGEVIGINSGKSSDSSAEGMGYAIPISKASPILDELMSRKTRTKLDSNEAGYLGVSVADLSVEASFMYGIPTGAFVAEAFEGEAASNAGIRQGDIIVELDGSKVEDRSDLIDKLSYYAAGESVELVIARRNLIGDYEKMSVTVIMGIRPQ